MVSDISPKLSRFAHEIDLKISQSPFFSDIDHDKFFIYLRQLKQSLSLYREENIPLQSKIALKQKLYSQITGSMTIEKNGQK